MAYEIENFERDVIERSRRVPVVVDFWASWCGPCRMLGPVLERLAASADGAWELAKVNTEMHVDIARRYRISGIPAVKLFIDGEAVDEFTGALPEYQVKRWLDATIPGAASREIARAREMIARGDESGARDLLEALFDQEPDNEEVRIALAQTALEHDHRRAVALIEPVREGSPWFETAESIRLFAHCAQVRENPESLPESRAKPAYLAAIDALEAGDFDAALGGFIEAMKADRALDQDGARRACIAIFALLGEEHELTKKYRRPFGAALY
jgi:putative thioredoxin